MRQQYTQPIPVRKSVRRDEWRGLTSVKAGVINPIAFFPLLREDRLRGRLAIQVKMAEAVSVIVNPIKVTCHAWLVPKIALPRFEGSMETLNRSYAGETLPGGGAAPAWFQKEAGPYPQGDKGHEIYDKLGLHYGVLPPTETEFNDDLVQSYNTIVNFRRTEASQALTPFNVLDKTLKPAFWDSWRFDYIKPSFDAAMMEGAVPVGIDGTAPVLGITRSGAVTVATQAGSVSANADYFTVVATASGTDQIAFGLPGGGGSSIVADLSGATGASISLANIELARQTQAFAKLRERYAGLPDEYLVDLLMQGINIPPEDFKQPVLIGRGQAVIGQQERYATDGASLDISVANGVAQLGMSINTPAVNTGGMVIVTMEIVPEQLYERVEDLAMLYPAGGSADSLPNYIRDFLDPQKVEIVPNSYVDNFHSTPDGIFGYAPLNHRWNRTFSRVGGRFKRPIPDTFVEDRTRIWAVEKADPELAEDFYICPQPFPHTVFADADADPFEVICVGTVEIVGNTVMGAGFEEDENAYEKVLAQVDQTRITSEAGTTEATVETEVIEDATE